MLLRRWRSVRIWGRLETAVATPDPPGRARAAAGQSVMEVTGLARRGAWQHHTNLQEGSPLVQGALVVLERGGGAPGWRSGAAAAPPPAQCAQRMLGMLGAPATIRGRCGVPTLE